MLSYAQGNKMHEDNGERERLRAVLLWLDMSCHRVGAGGEQDQVKGPAKEL